MAYGFNASITVDNTKVGGAANLTDFPVLVKGTYDGTGGEPDIRTTGNGGNVENTDATGGAGGGLTVPADLAFYNDASATTQYDHEITSYSASTGAITAWVKIPTLDYNDDTVFYMHYGDSGVTTSQEDVGGTWSNGYEFVLHLEEADGTAPVNSVDGASWTTVSNPTEGQTAIVDDGILFNGSSDIYHTSRPSYTGTLDSISISAWIYTETLQSSPNNTVMQLAINDDDDNAYISLRHHNTATPDMQSVITMTPSHSIFSTTSPSFPEDTWIHVGLSWDSADNTTRLYKDGSQVNSDDTTGSDIFYTGSADPSIGGNYTSSAGQLYDGTLDEVRMSSTGRTEGWTNAEYNNQNSPSTFYTMGSESGGAPDTAVKDMMGGYIPFAR